MTPKEKADQLIRRFTLDFTMDFALTKQASLIAVDEIIEFMSPYVNSKEAYDYWQEVKQEIEKL